MTWCDNLSRCLKSQTIFEILKKNKIVMKICFVLRWMYTRDKMRILVYIGIVMTKWGIALSCIGIVMAKWWIALSCIGIVMAKWGIVLSYIGIVLSYIGINMT